MSNEVTTLTYLITSAIDTLGEQRGATEVLPFRLSLNTDYSNVPNVNFIGPQEDGPVTFRYEIREWIATQAKGKCHYHMDLIERPKRYGEGTEKVFVTYATFELERDLVLFKMWWF